MGRTDVSRDCIKLEFLTLVTWDVVMLGAPSQLLTIRISGNLDHMLWSLYADT